MWQRMQGVGSGTILGFLLASTRKKVLELFWLCGLILVVGGWSPGHSWVVEGPYKCGKKAAVAVGCEGRDGPEQSSELKQPYYSGVKSHPDKVCF